MPRRPRTRIFDLSRPNPALRQKVTAGSADFCACWSTGLLAALATQALLDLGPTGPAWVLTGVAVLLWGLDAIVLAGLTGQTLGGMVAQTARVSVRTGRPVGIPTMARLVVLGGLDERDPDFAETRRVTCAPAPR